MGKFRFGRLKRTLTLDFAGNSTVITTTVDVNGLLWSTNVKTAATVDSAATTAVKLTDADGIDVFSRTGLAVNTNTQAILSADTRVPLSGVYTLTVTFSAAQTANRVTEVTLLIDRG